MNKNEKFVITINREVGSGGRTVGRLLAERLNVKYYDKALVAGLTEKFGLTLEEIERIKAQKKTWWNEFNNYYKTLVNSPVLPMEAEVRLTTESMFETEKAILEGLAQEESCVVAGRSSFLVFRDWPNHLSVFVQDPCSIVSIAWYRSAVSPSRRLVMSSNRWIRVVRPTSRNMMTPPVTIPVTTSWYSLWMT